MVSSTRKISLPHFLHLIFTTSQGYQRHILLSGGLHSTFRARGVIFVDMADRLSADEVSTTIWIATNCTGHLYMVFALSLLSPVHLEEKVGGHYSSLWPIVGRCLHHGLILRALKKMFIGSAVPDVAPEEELAGLCLRTVVEPSLENSLAK